MALKYEKEQSEIKRLRSGHPLYVANVEEWSFFLSAYEGGKDFANGNNLFRHVRENESDYNDRVKRLHNMNYCEPIIDFFTNFIFSETIERNGGSDEEFFRGFTKDVNLKGDTIDEFMKQVCDDMQIFGMSYVLVDSPPTPEGVITKAQEMDYNIRPYWVLVKPVEILDWVVDPFMRYLYAKRVQLGDVVIGGKRISVETYTEMFPDRYVISQVDVSNRLKPVYMGRTELPNLLGEIPLEVAKYKKSKKEPYLGLSFIRDFAYNNREIMNLTSLLQEFLYRQAFNVLAREVDTTIPLVDQEDGTIGTSNVMDVPKGANFPQYISPPPAPAEFIQAERGRIKNEMFMRAAQDTLNELFNGEKSSGFSQAQSFAKSVPSIATRADTLERMETRLMELTMKVMSREWTGKVRYKDRYEITNLTDALTQLLMIVNDLKLPSETFVKESMKRVVSEFDDKLPPDIKFKIRKEIDAMDFDKWQSQLKSAKAPGDSQKPKSSGTMDEIAKEAHADNTKAVADTK